MAYKNAREVLPDALLRQIWKYVEGENIYIPKREEHRAAWGSRCGTRQEYEERNKQIRRRYAVQLCQRQQISCGRVRRACFPFGDSLPADTEGFRDEFLGHAAGESGFLKFFRQRSADGVCGDLCGDGRYS